MDEDGEIIQFSHVLSARVQVDVDTAHAGDTDMSLYMNITGLGEESNVILLHSHYLPAFIYMYCKVRFFSVKLT
jgi:hypothetical protein